MSTVEFEEPKRECDTWHGTIRCGTHVIKFGTGLWWCPACESTRTLATTVEIDQEDLE